MPDPTQSKAPDVPGMVNDPAFQKMAPAQQRESLSQLTNDQSFRTLSDGDTLRFVSTMKKQAAPAAAPMSQDQLVQAQRNRVMHMTSPQGQLVDMPAWQAGQKLKEGYKVGPPNQQGMDAQQGVDWTERKQLPAGPGGSPYDAMGSSIKGFLNRAGQTAGGIASTLNPVPDADMRQRIKAMVTGDPNTGFGSKVLGAFEASPVSGPIVSRLGRGFVGAVDEGSKQAGQQLIQANDAPGGDRITKALMYARAANTGAATLNPLATGAVTNVNTLSDQGKSGEAAGAGAFDIAALGMGTKPGQQVVRGGAKILSKLSGGASGEEAITAAVRPQGAQIPKFRAAVQSVKGELAGVDSLEGLRDRATQGRTAAAQDMNDALQKAGANTSIDTGKLWKTITDTKIDRADQIGGVGKRINNFASEYIKPGMNVAQAADEIQSITAKQGALKNMSAAEKLTYFKANPEALAMDNIKNELVRQIDEMTGSQDFRAARAKYANWRTIEDNTQRSINDSVAKGGAERTGAIPKLVKRSTMVLPLAGAAAGGKLFGTEGAMGGAAAGRAAEGAILTRFASPDHLIQRGVQSLAPAAGGSGVTANAPMTQLIQRNQKEKK